MASIQPRKDRCGRLHRLLCRQIRRSIPSKTRILHLPHPRRPHRPPSPASRARTIAWARSVTPSLAKMLVMWLRTVLSETTSRRAISALDVAVRDQGEQLLLAIGEHRERSGPGRATWRRQHTEDPAGHVGPEDRLPCRNRAHGVQDALAVGALDQVATRAGLERGVHRLVVLEHAQDQDRDVGMRLEQPASGLDPADAGHVQVHEDDVGTALGCDQQRLLAVGGLTHDLTEASSASTPITPSPEDRVVVGDEDADHRASLRERRQAGLDPGALARAERHRAGAPELLGPLAHRLQPVADGGRRRPGPVVGDGETQRGMAGVTVRAQPDPAGRRRRVPDRVGQRLGGDPVRRHLDRRGQLGQCAVVEPPPRGRRWSATVSSSAWRRSASARPPWSSAGGRRSATIRRTSSTHAVVSPRSSPSSEPVAAGRAPRPSPPSPARARSRPGSARARRGGRAAAAGAPPPARAPPVRASGAARGWRGRRGPRPRPVGRTRRAAARPRRTARSRRGACRRRARPRAPRRGPGRTVRCAPASPRRCRPARSSPANRTSP